MIRLIFPLICLLYLSGCNHESSLYIDLPNNTIRTWLGPDLWANRIEDWQINSGRIECINGYLPSRTVHIISAELSRLPSFANISVELGKISDSLIMDNNTLAGFLLGAGDIGMDYRARALVHGSSGKNGGLFAGVDGLGNLVFRDNENELNLIPSTTIDRGEIDFSVPIKLFIEFIPIGNNYNIYLRAINQRGSIIAEKLLEQFPAKKLSGNIALLASNGKMRQQGATFWFDNITLGGDKIKIFNQRRFGPVYGVNYNLSRGTLKINAQFAPVSDSNLLCWLETKPAKVRFWKKIDSCFIDPVSYTALFEIKNWNDTISRDFRIGYRYPDNMVKHTTFFTGKIQKNPVDKDDFTMASISCGLNVITPVIGYDNKAKFDFTPENIFFPHAEIDSCIRYFKPDLIFCAGDQIYESHPYTADKSGTRSSYLNYLNKWYLFYWSYNEILRNTPSIIIPDDHDYFHINLWGEGGKMARDYPKGDTWQEAIDQLPEQYQKRPQNWQFDGGGFIMPPDWVNMVEKTQTGALPEPWDTSALPSGIRTYYTDVLYGGINFAIIEDRKFKSSPDIVPNANAVDGRPTKPNFNAKVEADVTNAILLGNKQMEFLAHWVEDWDDVQMKICLSQSIFCNLSTVPGSQSEDRNGMIPPDTYPSGHELVPDFDSHGWPQSERDQVLKILRKGYVTMFAGDQHLGSIVKHGTDEWNDAGYSFCSPAVASIAARRWLPPYPGKNPLPHSSKNTGEYEDPFGNKITVMAVANPVIQNIGISNLYDRAPGYVIAKFDKSTQDIQVECWPRWKNPSEDEQFEGWPFKFNMIENYGIKTPKYLPPIRITGLDNYPVIKIYKTDELVYALRLKDFVFQPKVPADGKYHVEIIPDNNKPAFKMSVMAKSILRVDTLEVNF